MPTTKQKYVLSQRHQLIDLNKTYKNFKLQFQVVATESNKDFHAIVLNQEQLDGTTDLQNIEMKLAKGRIGGTIVADNDKYQNYFLVLKSIQPEDNVEVEVTTNLEEVEARPQEKEKTKEDYSNASPSTTTTPNETTTETTAGTTTGTATMVTTKPSFYKSPWFWILLLALVVGGAYYYYFYIHKKSGAVAVETTGTPLVEPPVVLAESSPLSQKEVPSFDTTPIVAAVDTTTTSRSKKTSSKQNLYNKLAEIA
jgi:F0F1-type ATP synthase assembly protein I